MESLEDIKQTFTVEAGEKLQEMERAVLRLEEFPDDQDTINALFRGAHTIKGSAGMLGIEPVERFTHKVENMLERVRRGEIRVTGELIELLLKCIDHMSGLIELVGRGEEMSPGPEIKTRELYLLKKIAAVIEGREAAVDSKVWLEASKEATLSKEEVLSDNWHISLRFGKDVLRNGMDPISFINYLFKLGEIVSMTTLTDAVPSIADMDPESCYLGFEIDFKSEFDKKTIEDVFEFVKDDCEIRIIPPHSRIDEYVGLINALPESTSSIGEILINGGALTRSELEIALREQRAASEYCRTRPLQEECKVPPLGEVLVKEGVVYPEVINAAVEKQKKAKEALSQEAKNIRVSTDKLDHLVNIVGELVIANAVISQHARRIGDEYLSESASSMSRLVDEVRETAMSTRMIPIGETFNRFHRVIHDIKRESGKDMELFTSGGDTELDKTVIEKIGDPIMHLVRNAADHGIEMPDERLKMGKPAGGNVRLNASQGAGSIIIEVSDDGRGLNRDKILQKAVERGLIAANQSLSDSDMFRLIFEPGFSTAEKLTKLSGRGVGLDVVKKNIEALRGTVDIESSEGKGTSITIRLPLTLAIIDGFMITTGDSTFVIPLEMVAECFELSEVDKKAERVHKYINLRGTLLPYIRLRDFFEIKGDLPSYEYIVMVQFAGRKIGVVVDRLMGEIQTVIKSLGRMYRDVKGISGATILGDGTVALILDVPRLVVMAEESVEEKNNM